MTTKQMVWASMHDWYKGRVCLGVNSWQVVARDDMVAGGVLSFTDYNLLKEWAGY